MIDFGNQAVGTMSTQQMTITNTSNEALGITEVTVSGDYSATDNCVAASPLSPSGSCSISVTFGPTTTGVRIGSVNVTTDFHVIPIAFKLTGTE